MCGCSRGGTAANNASRTFLDFQVGRIAAQLKQHGGDEQGTHYLLMISLHKLHMAFAIC